MHICVFRRIVFPFAEPGQTVFWAFMRGCIYPDYVTAKMLHKILRECAKSAGELAWRGSLVQF